MTRPAGLHVSVRGRPGWFRVLSVDGDRVSVISADGRVDAVSLDEVRRV